MNKIAIENAAVSIYENVTNSWVIIGGKLPPEWRPSRRYTSAEIAGLTGCSFRRVPYTDDDILDAAGLVDYNLRPTKKEMAAIMARFHLLVADIAAWDAAEAIAG